VNRVADYGLIQVSNLDGDMSIGAANRSQIAGVTVTAYPERRPFRQSAQLLSFQPIIKLDGATADVGMGRAGHLECLLGRKRSEPIPGCNDFFDDIYTSTEKGGRQQRQALNNSPKFRWFQILGQPP
jgi:hypothetical protein